jgi:hypothetical protein
MAKLTKAQRAALVAMDTWRKGLWIATTQLTSDGVGIGTLRSLHAIDLIDAEQTRTGKYWLLLPAGRAALSEGEP